MGINDLFIPQYDLKGIGPGELCVNAGVHEAYFKTDEEGSEGAAATGFGGIMTTSIQMPKPPVEFVADRPFLELVVYKPTNAILFLNRIEDPR